MRIGFGWVILILGAAQLDSAAVRWRLVYVATIALLQIYKYPWPNLFTGG